MNLPKRKPLRYKEYDYSKDGYYFITICTHRRKQLLSKIKVGEAAHSLPKNELTQIGRMVNRYILNINSVYNNIFVDKFIIMPNHIHLIIAIDNFGTPWAASPTMSIPKILNSFKTMTSKRYGFTLWQRGYHDHIIRNKHDYAEIWEYIEYNPFKWELDRYYIKP